MRGHIDAISSRSALPLPLMLPLSSGADADADASSGKGSGPQACDRCGGELERSYTLNP